MKLKSAIISSTSIFAVALSANGALTTVFDTADGTTYNWTTQGFGLDSRNTFGPVTNGDSGNYNASESLLSFNGTPQFFTSQTIAQPGFDDFTISFAASASTPGVEFLEMSVLVQFDDVANQLISTISYSSDVLDVSVGQSDGLYDVGYTIGGNTTLLYTNSASAGASLNDIIELIDGVAGPSDTDPTDINSNFGVTTYGGGGFDSAFAGRQIVFTFDGVPEPSTTLLGAIAGLGLITRRARR